MGRSEHVTLGQAVQVYRADLVIQVHALHTQRLQGTHSLFLGNNLSDLKTELMMLPAVRGI